MKIFRLALWLALAGVLLLPACKASKPTLQNEPGKTPSAATLTISYGGTPTSEVISPTQAEAYPNPESGQTSPQPQLPQGSYPAPPSAAPAAVNTPAGPLPTDFPTPTPRTYPGPQVGAPAVGASASATFPSVTSPSVTSPGVTPSLAVANVGSTSPYPGPASSPQAGSTLVTTSTTSQGSSPYPAPMTSTPTFLIPTATTSAANLQPTSPYPGPSGSATLPPKLATPVGIPTRAPQAAAGTPGSTPPALGTPVPATASVVRVSQQVSDPSKVKLASGKAQVVEFFAYWSPLSKSMAPVLNALQARHAGRIDFVFLDVDNSSNAVFMKTLGYQLAPQIFLLDSQGKIIRQWKGFVKEEDLEAAFTSAGISQ